ncbi:phosphate ABC transporter permease PstA [Nocardioides sp. CFH 31398]|uniref:phosphate ABC transporter permease PstA n=1 Tax=Nocardioides sp. CFH 31398 TaxID=2919579 RepID=UPI001F0587B1|nr:phosphate ABC transporter permease PstA [Nocardioides sp. CFH 31398]MCH1866038.1 phosphate ABC transporter permease PstA [Nocardioides sp. CFH 31398]
MSQTLEKKPAPSRDAMPLSGPRMPGSAPYLVAAAALAVGVGLGMILGGGLIAMAILAGLTFIVGITVWAWALEGRRSGVDRLVMSVVWAAFAVALVPLASLVWTVLSNGIPALSAEFFTYSMRGVIGDEPGGIYHALIGTLLITLGATVISVPVGIMTAIYIVEYGRTARLAKAITFLVDVMTGIPSIVAGLFAYALFVLIFGPGVRLGFGGSVALSLLMIPVVVRATEEMLKLVPDELREASYALGVPKWRTIVKVVLPTSLSGILTGVTLAIARVIGETAPLLIIAGSTDSVNFNLFADRMQTLPVFIYYAYTQPGVPPDPSIERAWGAALVLIAIVMLLNLLARVVGKVFAPKTGR